MIIMNIINIVVFIVIIIGLGILEFYNDDYMYYSYFFTIGYILYESIFYYVKKCYLNKKEAASIIEDDKKEYYTFTGVTFNPYPSKIKGTHDITFYEEKTFCYRKKKTAPVHYPDFLMYANNEKKHTKPLKCFYFWNFSAYKPRKEIRNPADFFQYKDKNPFKYEHQEVFKEYFKISKPLKETFKIPFFNYSLSFLAFISFITFYFELNYAFVMLGITLSFFSFVGIFILLETTFNVKIVNKFEKYELFNRNKFKNYLSQNIFKNYEITKIHQTINLENFHSKGMKPLSFDMLKKEEDNTPRLIKLAPDFHNIKYKYVFKLHEDLDNPFDNKNIKELEDIKKFMVEENIDIIDINEKEKWLIDMNFNNC